jgi:hypothetical protein
LALTRRDVAFGLVVVCGGVGGVCVGQLAADDDVVVSDIDDDDDGLV